MKKNHPDYFIDGIRKGDIAILARAITLVESLKASDREQAELIVEGLMPLTGNSFRLGITGVPGVGKSTFIESFGKEAIARGHKLAVLAIDPSSSKSKGSILGDKTRMESLSAMPGVFIRPSPSGGELGGITKATYETILLCEAAGYDFIIVETVGVGQSEVAVNNICDFFLLLMLAGAGDELQGVKRGIMEMADALAINKADGSNLEKAKAARSEFAHAMHLLQAPESGWIPKTLLCSALTGYGIDEMYNMINEYQRFTQASGYFQEKRKHQQYNLLLNYLNEQILQRFYSNPAIRDKMQELKIKPNFQPFSESKELLKKFFDANP